MTSLHPLRALQDTWNDFGAAINAAREFRQAGTARSKTTTPADPQTAAIPL